MSRTTPQRPEEKAFWGNGKRKPVAMNSLNDKEGGVK